MLGLQAVATTSDTLTLIISGRGKKLTSVNIEAQKSEVGHLEYNRPFWFRPGALGEEKDRQFSYRPLSFFFFMSKGRVKGGKNTRTGKRWDNGVGRSMVFDVAKLSVGPYVPAQQLQVIQRLLTSA